MRHFGAVDIQCERSLDGDARIRFGLPKQEGLHRLLLRPLALSDSEELGAAGPTSSLSGRTTVLQGNRGGATDLSLGSALEAIGFHVDASFFQLVT